MKRFPQSVQEIADAIGRDEALSLIRQLPRAYSKGHPSGQPILYVPQSIAPDHALVTLIGFVAAEKLARAFGGEILYPAACIDIDRAARNSQIARLLREGASEIEVARLFGLSDRHIRNIRREIAPEGTRAETSHDRARLKLLIEAAA